MEERLHRPIGRISQCIRIRRLEGKKFWVWKWSCILDDSFTLTFYRSQLSRSMKSLRAPWYQRPMVKNNQYMNIQKGAIVTALVAIVSKSSFFIHRLKKLFSLYDFTTFLVCIIVYHCLWSLWFILLFDGCTRINSLWLLHHLIWVRLRWK